MHTIYYNLTLFKFQLLLIITRHEVVMYSVALSIPAKHSTTLIIVLP